MTRKALHSGGYGRSRPLGVLPLTILLLTLLGPAADARAQGEARERSEVFAGEAPTLRFEHLGLEDGMAQASAQTIMQDSAGFIWIGTQGGLHRYDGHEFEVYAATPFDTTSLSDSNVMGIAEAEDGDLWVATAEGGLNRLDPATGRAVHYRHDPDDPESLASDALGQVLEASGGDVWVLAGTGVDRMRAGEDGRFEHFRHDPDDPATLSAPSISLSEDTEGSVWVSTTNGIDRIDPRTGDITRFLHEPGASPGGPRTVFDPYFPPEAPGTAWLPTADGLVRLDTETGAHERFLVVPNEGGLDPRNRLYEVHPDPNDPAVLWASGSGAGVVRFDTRTETFSAYRHDPRDPHSLSSDDVVSFLADRSGTMWVGTRTAGLSVFNPKSVDFAHLRHDPDDPQSLAPGAVLGLYEDGEGTLWAGTRETQTVHYLTRFDAGAGRVTRYRHRPGVEGSLQAGSLSAFAEDASGHLWVGHFGGKAGLSRIDRATGGVTRFHRERTPENQRRNAIASLTPVPSDRAVLWVGSAGGLDRFDTRTGRFTPVPLELEGRAEEPLVLSLHADAAGTLWAGTTTGLVRVADGEATLAAAYDARDTTSISNNSILDIHERAAEPGVLWLATSGGLNRFDTRTGRATHYTEADGLANSVVYGLLEDEAGTLWMSTNGGLSNFDPETETFRTYGLDDGLMALEYNSNAFAEGAGGVLYFGSMEGVTAFSPENLSTNAVPPPVALTGFRLFNKPVAVGPGSPLEQPLSETERITLAHDQNEVGFEFVGLHFGNPAKNRYAYRLEGHDAEWIEADAQHRTATYTNLPPGAYTFRVRAANPDGVWNEEGASVRLRITPPWWRTLWAYLGFATIFGLGVFAVDRVQRRRLAGKEAERAALREAELRAEAQVREAELQVEAQARRRADAERLAEIGRAITSTLSVREVIDRVYEPVNALMDAAVFGIGIYDGAKNRLVFPATKEKGETLRPYTNALDDESRPAVWAFTNREPLVVGDWANEYGRYLPERAAPVEGEDVASIIYLPLVHQGKAVGVITTQSFARDAYTDYHVSVLNTLATYAAIALDNAESYERLDHTLADLKTMQAQLVQQEKLASLGALTAGIAHEIKNPLNFVTNFAEVNEELADELREDLAAHPAALAAVEDLLSDLEQNSHLIAHHGQRADSIVRSMMAHARGGEGERRAVELNAFVDEYVDLAYHGQRARVPDFNAEIVRDYDEAVGDVELLPQEVGRVLINLLSNAFDAVYEYAAGRNGRNGQGDGEPYEPRVEVTTRRSSGQVEIRVADNGPGIPEEVRAKIFEPFFTTKPTGQGTGLGLSMSHDIVTQGHGGTLEVESAPGAGTAFTVTLPAGRTTPVA